MDIETDTDTGITVLEELDFEVVCEGTVPTVCEQPAVWVGTFSCCGRQVFSCDHHRQVSDASFVPTNLLRDAICRQVLVTIMWAPLK